MRTKERGIYGALGTTLFFTDGLGAVLAFTGARGGAAGSPYHTATYAGRHTTRRGG